MGTRPLSRPLPISIFDYFDYISVQSRDGGTDFASVCKEPTQRSGRVVLYASWHGAVSAGRGVFDEHVHRAASSTTPSSPSLMEIRECEK